MSLRLLYLVFLRLLNLLLLFGRSSRSKDVEFLVLPALIENDQCCSAEVTTLACEEQRLVARARVTVPAQVCFVAVDFETDLLRDHLIDAGLDTTRPSFVTWLGVIQYLSRDAVAETFTMLGDLAAGTELTVEYVLPTDMRGDAACDLAERLTVAAAALGEPWLTFFSPAEMATLLKSCGFSVFEQVSQREQVDAVVWQRSDGLHPIELSQLARAVVQAIEQIPGNPPECFFMSSGIWVARCCSSGMTVSAIALQEGGRAMFVCLDSAWPFTAGRYGASVIGHKVPTEQQRLHSVEQMLDPDTIRILQRRASQPS